MVVQMGKEEGWLNGLCRVWLMSLFYIIKHCCFICVAYIWMIVMQSAILLAWFGVFYIGIGVCLLNK